VAGPLLSQTGDDLGRALGLPPLVGPFIFSGIAFAVSSILVATLLRTPPAGHLATDAPEPVAVDATAEALAPVAVDATAEALAPDPGADALAPDNVADSAGSAPAPPPRIGAWHAMRLAIRNPTALVAILAIVCSQTVMVGVMVMTPVHMVAHGLSISLVGVVLSVHILGMYGASPLMGWLADRLGSLRVIGLGVGILVVATTISILAPADDILLLPLALGLLGLGWSAGLIGGSTLLTTAVEERLRVPLQGATDASMNVAAAASAALSGVVLGAAGFAGVNVVALLVLSPLVIAAVRLVTIRRRATA
ncbi:MAG TPA: MFS transporter, partial [Agromyces sp.]|nr:MFS transporter [Agromyces sp.]